jgi:hypothetical protein
MICYVYFSCMSNYQCGSCLQVSRVFPPRLLTDTLSGVVGMSCCNIALCCKVFLFECLLYLCISNDVNESSRWCSIQSTDFIILNLLFYWLRLVHLSSVYSMSVHTHYSINTGSRALFTRFWNYAAVKLHLFFNLRGSFLKNYALWKGKKNIKPLEPEPCTWDTSKAKQLSVSEEASSPSSPTGSLDRDDPLPQ